MVICNVMPCRDQPEAAAGGAAGEGPEESVHLEAAVRGEGQPLLLPSPPLPSPVPPSLFDLSLVSSLSPADDPATAPDPLSRVREGQGSKGDQYVMSTTCMFTELRVRLSQSLFAHSNLM